jgi:hypothetical protein
MVGLGYGICNMEYGIWLLLDLGFGIWLGRFIVRTSEEGNANSLSGCHQIGITHCILFIVVFGK